jgi:hypothetical protein
MASSTTSHTALTWRALYGDHFGLLNRRVDVFGLPKRCRVEGNVVTQGADMGWTFALLDILGCPTL